MQKIGKGSRLKRFLNPEAPSTHSLYEHPAGPNSHPSNQPPTPSPLLSSRSCCGQNNARLRCVRSRLSRANVMLIGLNSSGSRRAALPEFRSCAPALSEIRSSLPRQTLLSRRSEQRGAKEWQQPGLEALDAGAPGAGALGPRDTAGAAASGARGADDPEPRAGEESAQPRGSRASRPLFPSRERRAASGEGVGAAAAARGSRLAGCGGQTLRTPTPSKLGRGAGGGARRARRRPSPRSGLGVAGRRAPRSALPVAQGRAESRHCRYTATSAAAGTPPTRKCLRLPAPGTLASLASQSWHYLVVEAPCSLPPGPLIGALDLTPSADRISWSGQVQLRPGWSTVSVPAEDACSNHLSLLSFKMKGFRWQRLLQDLKF